MEKQYKNFKEFYPFYLSQHENKICRVLHFVGSTVVLVILVFAISTQTYKALFSLPIAGYGFAWVGHFFFEKNRPATFTYPVYSLIGDWVMYYQLLTRKINF
ncbi:DUF962 domain-containing protein [Bacteriovorax sp. Seq25_V]|uniref:DUF962 domain-containing protein n=1 Tax=Bacteriovorax sp. Seq25_V TaxID=1201288 RepID=UPI0004274052|nr:DUF962 domain-containing protein [Bacteriovorax sp. Seq25_V]